MTYFDDLKYEQLASNTDEFFKRAYIFNFDIINHDCWGYPVKNAETYYQTIRKKDFNNYEDHVQNRADLSAIKSERNNVYFEHGILKRHFKPVNSKIDIEKE